MDSKQSGQFRFSIGWRTISPSLLLRVSPQAGLLLVNIVLWVIFGLVAEGFLSSFNSSDMPEMIHLADRILVMNDMQLVDELQNSRDYDEMSQLIIHANQRHLGEVLEQAH